MPGVKIFGRKWGVGSDDFVFPMAVEVPVRVVWLVVLAAVLNAHTESFTTCYSGYLLRLYYIGSLVILSLAILLGIVIMYNSMLGSILDPDMKRKHIPVMVAVKLVLFLPEIAWLSLGTSWAFAQDLSCATHVVLMIRGATVAGWILVSILLFCIFVVFDPLGRPSSRYSEEERAARLWKLRCKLLCCCIAIDNDNTTIHSGAFDDVSRLLADYFLGSNFVMTDIAAGLILVQQQQQSQSLTTLRRYNLPLPIVESSSSSAGVEGDLCYPSWMNLRFAEHYMKFALASYGWMFFVYDNRCTGPTRLFCNCKCCSCVRRFDNKIRGDNCCRCNTSAILQQTGIQSQDILYANFENKLYEIPFYIALDHVQKSVIIAIRGTLSFYDALTDLTVNSEDIEIENVPEAKAHKGILQAAKYIQSTIRRFNLLDEAFQKTPGYRLVLTGHSLGAGAAAILSILLKSTYPNLICFSFSPPGWLVSLPLSRYANDFVCSVVVGKDIVPRIGVITMTQLKGQVARQIRNCNTPKYRILLSGLTKAVCDCSTEEFEYNQSEQTEYLLGDTFATEQHRRYTEEQPTRILPRQWQSMVENPHPLYIPGHVLYLEKVLPAKGCCGEPKYEAFWSRPEHFNEVLVSTEMLTDHMPNVVYRALRDVATGDEMPSYDHTTYKGRQQEVV